MFGGDMPRSKGRTGRPWRRVVTEVQRTQPDICSWCGHPGANETDHIQEMWMGGAERDIRNLARIHGAHYRCPVCGLACNQVKSHALRRAAKQASAQAGPRQSTITVVTGPPCSGKTTYVRQHAKPGDVIIDYDLIAQALGSPDTHDHPDVIARITRAARQAAIQSAVASQATTWVIETTVSPAKQRDYEMAGATFVVLEESRDVLHQRASQERPKLWHKLIDDWRAPNIPTRRTVGANPGQQYTRW